MNGELERLAAALAESKSHAELRELASDFRKLSERLAAAAALKLREALPSMPWSPWLGHALDRAARDGLAVSVELEALPAPWPWNSKASAASTAQGLVRARHGGSWWIELGAGGRRVQLSREPLDGHLVPTVVRCKVEVPRAR